MARQQKQSREFSIEVTRRVEGGGKATETEYFHSKYPAKQRRGHLIQLVNDPKSDVISVGGIKLT